MDIMDKVMDIMEMSEITDFVISENLISKPL